MSFATSLRTAVPLLIGLAIGGVGVALFHDSLPGADGSPEARASQMEVDLKQAKNYIAKLEGEGRGSRRRSGSVAEGARQLRADFEAGVPVDPDDILKMMQPFIHDLSPIFARLRMKEEKRHIEAKTGELARKYDLTQQQRDTLEKWFKQKSADDAKRHAELMGAPGVTLEDLARESMRVRPDEGLDQVMEGMLSGDKLANYKTTRMEERVQRVQQHADMRVQRLDGIVGLDDTQRDQVFGIMARNSPDYDPGMQLEGTDGSIGTTPGGDSRKAMLSVLRPDQEKAYEAERLRRRQEAESDMLEMGMKLPSNWDLLDQADF